MSRRELDQDCDVNLASIVDCFTVLITYLLAAGSFISLGMIPAEVIVDRAPDSAEVSTESVAPVEPPVTLTVEVMTGQKIRFSVWTGNESIKKEFSVTEQDQAAIKEYTQSLAVQYPTLKRAVVAADPGLNYGEFVKGAEQVKPFKILLANQSKL